MQRRADMLAYRFVATRGVEITGLRFPFALRWCAGRGIHQLSRSRSGERFRPCGEVLIHREEMFDVHMMPDATGAVTGRLEIDLMQRHEQSEPDWRSLALTYVSSGRGFGLAVTQSMFALPAYSWTLDALAARLGATPRAIQMALFRESYSFDAALRRCRYLHTLLRVGHAHCTFEAVDCPAW
jgi:hypothetical protein